MGPLVRRLWTPNARNAILSSIGLVIWIRGGSVRWGGYLTDYGPRTDVTSYAFCLSMPGGVRCVVCVTFAFPRGYLLSGNWDVRSRWSYRFELILPLP